MKLISEERRESGFNKIFRLMTPIIPNFVTGVNFAEEELKDLAIEFAEYAKKETFGSENMEIDYTELFNEFIKERNK